MIPTAQELRDRSEQKQQERKKAEIEKAQKALIPLLNDSAENRKAVALFNIPDEVITELKDKGFKVKDTGENIGTSWEITW